MYLALLLSTIAVILSAFTVRYFPILRRAAGQFVDSSEIVKGVVGEFNARMKEQDRRVADIAIRLDVLEERWTHAGFTSPRFEGIRYEAPVNREEFIPASHVVMSQTPGRVDRSPAPGKRSMKSPEVRKELSRAEQKVIERLKEGALTARQVQELLGSSREHAARVMKGLYSKGLVERDESKKPFTYTLPST